MESLAGLEVLPGGLYSNVKIQSQGGQMNRVDSGGCVSPLLVCSLAH